MALSNKRYEIVADGPKATSFDRYSSALLEEYQQLLDKDDCEKSYQNFFERNPCMLPISGNVNHAPLHGCLFSQPRLADCEHERIPDFMWITSNSLQLTPTFIEIEKPSKQAYRQSDDVQNASFSQAENQILEWKAILEGDGRECFYERYSVPSRLRDRVFAPRFVLIYGRRKEFEGNVLLTRKRAQKLSENFSLLSFDRLIPNANLMRTPSAKWTDKGVELLFVPATFALGPSIAADLNRWGGFESALNRSFGISEERKEFLIRRAAYWRDLAVSRGNSLRSARLDDWE